CYRPSRPPTTPGGARTVLDRWADVLAGVKRTPEGGSWRVPPTGEPRGAQRPGRRGRRRPWPLHCPALHGRRTRPFPAFRPRLVPGLLPRADAATDARLAGHRPRRIGAPPGTDRERQDAGRVPGLHRPADVRAAAAAGSPVPDRLRVSAEGAGGGRG